MNPSRDNGNYQGGDTSRLRLVTEQFFHSAMVKVWRMSGFMDCAGLTDIGRNRSSNEDQFLIADICRSMRVHQTSLLLDHQTRLFGNTHWKLLLVADGLGGHEAGERASQLVVDGIIDYVLNQFDWLARDSSCAGAALDSSLKAAIRNCQSRVEQEVAAIPHRQGMGSTLTLAFVVWPKLHIVHVGDSRCYLLRGGILSQITRDHTLAELSASAKAKNGVNAGDRDIDEVEARKNPMANVLWNVIGGGVDNEPTPDTSSFDLRTGDTLFLCSDGLSNMLSRQQITDVLKKDLPIELLCRELVSLANSAGGNDNITVVVSRFVDGQQRPLEEESVKMPFDELPGDTDEFCQVSNGVITSRKELR